MKKRFSYGLMVLLFCLAGWIATAVAEECNGYPEQYRATVSSTSENLPQWQDVGMCDILAVTSGSTLTPPTTVRVIHDSPVGNIVLAQAAQARHHSRQGLSAYGYHRVVNGYIYLIHCLRL